MRTAAGAVATQVRHDHPVTRGGELGCESLALAARTRKDLGGLLTDLPRIASSAEPRRRYPGRPLALGVLVLSLTGVLLTTILSVAARHGLWFPLWLIPIGFFGMRRLRLFRVGTPDGPLTDLNDAERPSRSRRF